MLNTALFLGYTWKGDKLAIVPEESETVRRIYREYLDGFTPGMIARKLMKENIPAPGGKAEWYQSTVKSILKNEKYAGDLLLQKYFVEDYLTHRIVKNTGQFPKYFVENDHEPIVPKQVYLEVQEEILRRAEVKKDPSRLRYGSRIVFSGRVECGLCGSAMKRIERGKGYRWRCRKRKTDTSKKQEAMSQDSCGGEDITEEELCEAVRCMFNRLPVKRDQLLRLQGCVTEGCITQIHDQIELTLKEISRLERSKDAESEETEDAEGQKETEKQKKGQEAGNEYRNGPSLQKSGDEYRNGLLLQESGYRRQALQIRLLLELVDEMKQRRERMDDILLGRCNNTASFAEPVVKASCVEYEDFFLWTRPRYPDDLMTETGYIRRFDNDMVIRYIEKIVVKKDQIEFHMKAGITLETERKH